MAGPAYIEADRYDMGADVVFYRDGGVFAHFPGSLVQEVSEVARIPGMTSYFSSEAQED